MEDKLNPEGGREGERRREREGGKRERGREGGGKREGGCS